jgi:hypothetical protein
MKKLLTFIFLAIAVLSCSSGEGPDETDTVWVYESGEIPEAEVASAKVTLKENETYITGYFELSVKNITCSGAFGKSDNITLQINFLKNNTGDDTPRPAYNIKGSTGYVDLINELYGIDDTPVLDWETYPGKLRVNDELFENVVFRQSN